MINEAPKFSDSVSSEDGDTIHISHQRDLVVFRAYSAIKCAIDAMVFAAETDTWDDPKKLKASLSVSEMQVSDMPVSGSTHSLSLQSGVSGGSEFMRARSISLRSTDSSVIQEISAYKEAFQDMYTK